MVTRHYELPDFHAIEVAGGLSVEIEAGRPQSIIAAARDEETLDRLELDVFDGTLRVSARHGFFGFFGGSLQLSITAPHLDRIETRGGSEVRFAAAPVPRLELEASAGARLVATGIDTEYLWAKASSGAKLVPSGRCDIAEIETSSGGAFEANGLDCARGELSSSSGSRISASASEAARVDASSGSSIRLNGRPERLEERADPSSSIRLG